MLSLLSAVAAATGCLLSEPSYENTAFRCELSASCPLGMACVSGHCVRPSVEADASPLGPGDAASPADAAVDSSQTMSFGERPGADVAGVTFDTYLNADDPIDRAGGDDRFAVDSGPIKVGLVRFDLRALAPTTRVLGAYLEVTVYDPLESGELVAHLMTVSWDEGRASYLERASGELWPTKGAGAGSYDETPVVSFAPRARDTYRVALPPAVVEGWLRQPERNFGLRWMSNSADGRGAEWRSSESDEANERPLLVVEYE